MTKSSRRDFLKTAGALSALGAIGAGYGRATSAGSGYQALVCIFLAGGNDSHNMVVPIKTSKQLYGLYAQGRGDLAIPSTNLLTINDGTDQYGLHPLMPELQGLYNAGNAAVIANVGMLMQPVTRDLYLSNQVAVPVALFSHADQVNQWQTAIPDGTATAGWGGLVEDNLAPLNNGAAFSPITSTSGCGLFCSGQQTFPATIPVGGVTSLLGANTASRLAAVQNLMTFDNGLRLVQTANTNLNHGVGFSKSLNAALSAVTIKTPFPPGILGQQLQTVAKVMSIRGVLGIERQVFFCQLGGFDTHGLESGTLSQPGTHDQLMQQLSQALAQFYAATQEAGTDKATVTFTASEFGRTLPPNSNAGTDHAWGSHHIVMGGNAANGGPLIGGKFYGEFPYLKLGDVDDANSRGTLIPTTSVDQYAATMAQWFGLSPAAVGGIFKYVGHFPTSNLGFLA